MFHKGLVSLQTGVPLPGEGNPASGPVTGICYPSGDYAISGIMLMKYPWCVKHPGSVLKMGR